MCPSFEEQWARCAPWLEGALHRGGDTLTLAMVRTRIGEGQYQFWPAPAGAVVTQVIHGETEKEFNILLAGGTLDQLEEMMPSLEAFGRAQGCVLFTVLGRRGWERTFLCQRFGYAPVATLYGKREA